jgi:hypothetical protein
MQIHPHVAYIQLGKAPGASSVESNFLAGPPPEPQNIVLLLFEEIQQENLERLLPILLRVFRT